jgi:hypothetical protein
VFLRKRRNPILAPNIFPKQEHSVIKLLYLPQNTTIVKQIIKIEANTLEYFHVFGNKKAIANRNSTNIKNAVRPVVNSLLIINGLNRFETTRLIFCQKNIFEIELIKNNTLSITAT